MSLQMQQAVPIFSHDYVRCLDFPKEIMSVAYILSDENMGKKCELPIFFKMMCVA